MKNIKYIPKIFTAVSFFILLIIFLILFLGRTNESLRFHFILNIFPDFYQHVSNLSLSYLIYATVGYAWIMAGVNIKSIIILGSAILLINFIYELWIPILNTRDIIDAYYGSIGTIIGFLFLFLTKQFGVKLNSADV